MIGRDDCAELRDKAERDRLYAAHCLRTRAHWGKRADVTRNWPQTDAEWRAVEHGSPCDTNVHMARWSLRLAQQMKDEGLLDTCPAHIPEVQS